MYSAIVFLPLLGAIIAGAIALFGSYRAAMVGAPAEGSDAGHHDHAAHAHDDHGHDAHAHDAHGHDDHSHGDHGHAPAAPGSRSAEIVTTGLLFVSAILAWIAFFTVTSPDGSPVRVDVLPWMQSGTLSFNWAFRIDTLTAVMLILVTTVSSLVHLYSWGYMSHDEHRPRFFGYLSLFTFAMLMLVTSDNLVQMFFGWEGVGLASYLLIGFWFQRPSANAAAIKAFVVNRVGDFGFVLGIFAVFVLFGSVDFDTIFANAGGIVGTKIHFLSWDLDALTVACLLLFVGAMGKSAQFLLHTWLPDAMEGPTPVSALIHAATMVTAGVFMVARMSPLFGLSETALTVVTFFGATTAFFAATIGLVQNDIKRVIAYSTCSQLGYMFVGLGTGAFATGIFHLLTHGFFKALLFLCAGSVIHAVSGEQDMRKMGGLRKRIPVTYWAMIAGTLAITGFPFTAGYFSKDAIIEAAYVAENPLAGYAWFLTVVAALLTSFYSWRLIFMTFHGEPRASAEVMSHVHESPKVMTIPLIVLSFGAIFAGMILSNRFIGEGYGEFWKTALFMNPENHVLHAMHELPETIKLAPTVMMVIGFLLTYWFYIRSPNIPKQLAAEQPLLYRFLLNKWYFDELYDFLFVRPMKWLGRFLWKKGDGWLIDGFGPDGVSARVVDVTNRVVKLQTGYVYHYAFAMLIGIAALVTWMMFAG
ncbi:NADH-quinone oxidoreductase subunit L [Kaistia geumhonensis]|uniref:NADH-ubiquinone oxidoreductase chain 5 n=1 Tax=Kaistia geumhonensis TaxID=410839 RepID=A0ABU0M2U5_9HYPH|nr:NADH-quinone oxidoreductase subunit L [Kaistia geumhonensis]MCX5479499.1 NADH-quinone oxidoreductase subunit L [Kaistia geumhonensis]MDQ0515277.1 NADH-quinone oxidoreductase subunit L [Kaistia geumhonensis]